SGDSTGAVVLTGVVTGVAGLLVVDGTTAGEVVTAADAAVVLAATELVAAVLAAAVLVAVVPAVVVPGVGVPVVTVLVLPVVTGSVAASTGSGVEVGVAPPSFWASASSRSARSPRLVRPQATPRP